MLFPSLKEKLVRKIKIGDSCSLELYDVKGKDVLNPEWDIHYIFKDNDKEIVLGFETRSPGSHISSNHSIIKCLNHILNNYKYDISKYHYLIEYEIFHHWLLEDLEEEINDINDFENKIK